MKNKTSKLLKISAALACAAVLAFGSTAQADIFVGAGDGTSWEDPLNWANGVVPLNGAGAPGTNILINGGHDVVFNSTTFAALVAASNTQSATQYRVPRFLMNESTGAGAIGDNSISFDFGNANTILTGNSTEVFGSRSPGTTTVNLDSGIINLGKTTTFGARNGGTGILNLNGGEFFTGRENILLGNGTGGTGIVNASGGALRTRGGLEVRDGSSFNVLGTGAQIGIGSQGSVDGFWVQAANATLGAAIDASGISTIFVDDLGGGATATFDAGSLLDLAFLGTPEVDGMYTLLELEGADIMDNGLALTAGTDAFDGTSGWTFAVDNSGTNGFLTATFVAAAVPEPSSLALIGLGGVFFAARRRRKA